MDASARQAYLETQILTSTPQRLRLMLIEGAIRRARVAQAAYSEGRIAEAFEAIGHCRDIVSELIAGIQPDQTPLARQILNLYMFLFSTLVEAQFGRDVDRLRDVVRVLEEERTTWQAVCQQMPQRPQPAAEIEELAPQRVAETWRPEYGPPAAAGSPGTAFAIDA